jgi:hypothetical protein
LVSVREKEEQEENQFQFVVLGLALEFSAKRMLVFSGKKVSPSSGCRILGETDFREGPLKSAI